MFQAGILDLSIQFLKTKRNEEKTKAFAAYQSSEWLYIDQHHDLLHVQQQFLLPKGNTP